MKRTLLTLILVSPLFSSLGEITIEVEGKTVKVFVEGKFQYSLEKRGEPPQLVMDIPQETYPYGTRRVLKEKGVSVIGEPANGGTRIVISPGVDFSYEDYWGAGYLVILLTLREKPRVPQTKIEKKPPPPRTPEKREKGTLFIYLNDAPKPLVYKALSKLTGQTFLRDTSSSRVTLRLKNVSLKDILRELKKR